MCRDCDLQILEQTGHIADFDDYGVTKPKHITGRKVTKIGILVWDTTEQTSMRKSSNGY